MKREALQHTKIKRLCRRMNIPLWQAVGLLETLWHVTARETPCGDIGKLTDEHIALALDFRGNETEMIENLIACGWLDRDEAHRLVIHDWFDHAEDSIHMKLARRGEFFVNNRAPKLNRLPAEERAKAAKFYSAKGGQKAKGSEQKANIYGETHGASLFDHEISTNQQAEQVLCCGTPQQQSVRTESTNRQAAVRTPCARNANPAESHSLSLSPSASVSLENPVSVIDSIKLHAHKTRAREDCAALNVNGNSPPFSEFSKRYPRHLYERESARIWKRKVTTESLPSFRACLDNYLESDEVSRNVVMNGPKWLEVASASDWQIRWPKPKSKSILAPEEEILKRMQADKEEIERDKQH